MQGEVGVACSMAAGALAEVLGGTPSRSKTSRNRHGTQPGADLRSGRRLVRCPAIERNAMGSVKAINAARMALRGDGTHFVSLER